MNVTIKNIDSYILSQPASVQTGLQKLREIIKSVAPEAEETISYSMPAFKYHGMLVGFAAAKNHFGFYPWNGSTVEKFKAELTSFATSKGSIQLPMNKPLPVALIKKIVKDRMKENIAKEKAKMKV